MRIEFIIAQRSGGAFHRKKSTPSRKASTAPSGSGAMTSIFTPAVTSKQDMRIPPSSALSGRGVAASIDQTRSAAQHKRQQLRMRIEAAATQACDLCSQRHKSCERTRSTCKACNVSGRSCT